jgi:hypothetical protein
MTYLSAAYLYLCIVVLVLAVQRASELRNRETYEDEEEP